MQLKQQFGKIPPKPQPNTLSTVAKYVVVATVLGIAVITLDASASPDKVDMLGTGLTALPAETLKVYSGLLKVVPLAVGAAAALAAMRGGMGYVMGLVGNALRA